MLKRRSDIVRRALKQEQGVEAAEERVVRQLKKLLADYNARVKAVIRNPRRFKSGKVSLGQASKLIDELADVLNEAGLDAVVNGYLDEYEQLREQTAKYFDDMSVEAELSGTSEKALETYIGFSERQLVDTAERKMVQPLQEALFQGVFAGRSTADLVADLEVITDGVSLGVLETLVAENMRRYQRALTVETAEEAGLEIYEYVGPDDAITSEQCKAILDGGDHGVAGMYLKEEISADMVDGLTENPLIAGGHINCRHKFMPVTEAYARKQGWED